MGESISEKHMKEALRILKSIDKSELEGMNSKEKTLFMHELTKMDNLLKKFEAKIG